MTDVWVHPTVRAFGDQLAADAGHPGTATGVAVRNVTVIRN